MLDPCGLKRGFVVDILEFGKGVGEELVEFGFHVGFQWEVVAWGQLVGRVGG